MAMEQDAYLDNFLGDQKFMEEQMLIFQQLEKSKSSDAALQNQMNSQNDEPKMQVDQPPIKEAPEDMMVEEQ